MNLTGGDTIEVWRASKRDKFGDATMVKIGTIAHVFIQDGTYSGLNFHRSDDDFAETAVMSTVAFIPKTTLRVQNRDRLKAGSRTYQVIGDRGGDYRHPMSGADLGYYMVAVEAAT